MKESDIKFEAGDYWVGKLKDSYTVFVNKITHSESICHFAKDEDGLSIAVAYCKYLAKRKQP